MYAEVIGFLVGILKTFSIPVFVFVAAYVAVKHQAEAREASLPLRENYKLPISDPRVQAMVENITRTWRGQHEHRRSGPGWVAVREGGGWVIVPEENK